MRPEQFKRLEELYQKAVGLPAEEIRAFLDSRCADDAELRAEIEQLLAQRSVDASALVGGIGRTSILGDFPSDFEPEAKRVGPYRLLRRIGEGGMGTVFEAEQETPVRRRVAIKLIKWGMDSKQVIARFESERQALALMNHPNIAQAHDAGATERGRPYFAMEYVQGIPITDYCDTHRLTTNERLKLFAQVCSGVQHAHQKGIIHRDLKPSNVLVTVAEGKAVPKIIDFGVAKAISRQLTEKTVYTELGQLIGTPEYMSPEQAEMTGLDVDTRTDVYSLGVLLYELLVGALPFDPVELRTVGFDEIRRRIREDQPLRPSTRLSSLGEASTTSSRNRGTSPKQLISQLRGDLDWITMRALEKDRTRRYGSASDLEADVRRFLDKQPVMAGPPSTLYRVRKFIQRHRTGVFAASVLTLGLASGVVGSIVGLVRARAEAARSERVASFLVDILGSVDAERLGRNLQEQLEQRAEDAARGRETSEARVEAAVVSFRETMRDVNWTDAGLSLIDSDILRPAGETIAERFGDEPRTAARLRATIGSTYLDLGLYDSAESHLRDALRVREQHLGRQHAETLSSINALAVWLLETGKPAEAEPLLRETLGGRRKMFGADHEDTLVALVNLGTALRDQGKLEEAEVYAREALDSSRRLLGERDSRTLAATNNMAELLHDQGRLDEAEPYYRNALETGRQVLGEDHLRTLIAINNLAMLLQDRGDLAEAEVLLRESLAGRRRVLGDDHPLTLTSMNNLALQLQNQGRLEEAEPYYTEALEGRRRALGHDHPLTLGSIHNMGFLRKAQGRLDEAESYYLESLQGMRQVLGDDHPATLLYVHNTAVLLQAQGRLNEAEQGFREALEGRRKVLGNDHYDTVKSIINLGSLLRLQDKPEEAEPYLREAVNSRRHVLGDDHPATVRSAVALASTLLELDRKDEAESLLLDAHAHIESSGGVDHPAFEALARNLIDLYNASDRPAQASHWQAQVDTIGRDTARN